MNIKEQEHSLAGVVCLHCGLHTPLPASIRRGQSTDGLTISNSAFSIVRCHRCGKEAPYLADEIVVFKAMANGLQFSA